MADTITRLNEALQERYLIERELGQGGMATVYLAEDLRHERKVALKVLKPELAAVLGAERFLAEIKTTAALQHPNILPLHDSGEADGFLFYVMPYVEGETLRHRLERERQLPVDDAVQLAKSLAEALDYAHSRGVIHRDIKPANVLLQAGKPVIADFGIALAVGAAGGGGRLTETGLSMGTPHYMSPEQATGDLHVGTATDIYALGCVLYEMLVGQPPYTGATPQAILGKIISGEPMSATTERPSVPAHVDAAIRKSLEKLPADRFTDAGGFVRALSDLGFRHGVDAGAMASAGGAGPWKRWAVAMTVVAALGLGAAGWALLTRTTAPARVTRLVVGLSEEQALRYTGTDNLPRLAIAPDGSRFVYMGWAPERGSKLWLRSFDQLEGQELIGTEGGRVPVISPEGDRVLFMVDVPGPGASLRFSSLGGGSPTVLVEDGATGGADWGPDGLVYFVGIAEGPTDAGLAIFRVAPSGGSVEQIMRLDLGSDYRSFHSPVVVTDRRILVTAVGQDASTSVHFVDLETGQSTYSVEGSGGRVTASGHFLYVTEAGALMAHPYRDGDAAPGAQATLILQGVGVRNNGIVDLTVSREGTLLYATEGQDAPERWVTLGRDGSEQLLDPSWTENTEFEAMALSPDGGRLAVAMDSQNSQRAADGRLDIWVKDLARGTPSRLTFEGNRNDVPAWTSDGERIAYVSHTEMGADAWVRPADGSGSPELLLDHERDVLGITWASDDSWVLAVLDGRSSTDIIALRPGSDDPPLELLTSEVDEWEPALSPDDRWLAYVSTENGPPEVFVVPFPDVQGGKWQISNGGGREPRWSADGQQLYIRHGDGAGIDVADMSAGPAGSVRSTVLDFPADQYFELNPWNHLYDVTHDGRFIMLKAGEGDLTGDLVLVQSFFRELEGLAGGG